MNALAQVTPEIRVSHGQPLTTSFNIAQVFGKQHAIVMRAIRNLDCSAEFRQCNFASASYEDAQGKPRPMYEVTRDGFAFLAMGFTGKTAAAWKERYIAAFNAMEAEILRGRIALPEIGDGPITLEQFHTHRDALQAAQVALVRCRVVLTGAEVLEAGRKYGDATATIIEMARAGCARDLIAQVVGRTRNYVRQVIFQARRDGRLPEGIEA